MTQSIQEEIGILPTIEPEGHLFQVCRQMLCADLVPSPHNAALQKRECGFNSVGMNVPVNVNLVTMANGFVLSAFYASGDHCFWISWKLIGHHHFNVGADVFLDVLRQCARFNITGVKESQIATALTQSDHNFLVVVGPIPPFTLAPFAAPNISFVHFYSTVQHGPLCLFHGSTNAMAEIPRC